MGEVSQGKTSSWWTWLSLFSAVLLIYVFSIGPIAYFNRKKMLSKPVRRFLGTVYSPLTSLAEHPTTGKPLILYVEWWVQLAEGRH